MKAIRQMVRGCRDLPHVGPHPGTWPLLLMLGAGAVSGIDRGGLSGAAFAVAFMAVFLCPLYLYGAYDRANLSDELESK